MPKDSSSRKEEKRARWRGKGYRMTAEEERAAVQRVGGREGGGAGHSGGVRRVLAG